MEYTLAIVAIAVLLSLLVASIRRRREEAARVRELRRLIVPIASTTPEAENDAEDDIYNRVETFSWKERSDDDEDDIWNTCLCMWRRS